MSEIDFKNAIVFKNKVEKKNSTSVKVLFCKQKVTL